jgi:hypothetical protein
MFDFSRLTLFVLRCLFVFADISAKALQVGNDGNDFTV